MLFRSRWNPWVIADRSLYNLGLTNYEWNVLLVALVLLVIVDVVRKVTGQRIDTFLDTQGALVKGATVIFMLLMIGIFGQYGGEFDAKQFIYFQF